MSTELSLQERETADRIREAVESTLKTRYTLIGVITAALISGGAYTAFKELTGKAQDEVNRANIVLQDSEKLLDGLRQQAGT